MFKIVMVNCGMRRSIEMPKDKNLNLFEATRRADLYAKRNRNAIFQVVNENNADIEYETQQTWAV